MEEKNKKDLKDTQISLKELIDINEWQRIQNIFGSIINIRIRTIDANGTPLTAPSSEPRLCKELIKAPHVKNELCDCLPTFLGGKALVDKNLSFGCVAGLHNFIVPIRVDGGSVICYVIFGPVILVMRKTKEEYHRIAEELNLELEELWNAILEIRVFSFNRIQGVVELVKTVGEYILKVAYQQQAVLEELSKIQASIQSQFNKLFNTLLEVSMQLTGADIGSIMLLDKSVDELTIRSSYGLSDEVIKSTKVRWGEGISGTAAKENRPILIGETSSDNRIRSFLNRPNIASSMVIPIKLKDKVLGVMNLAALQNSAVRFGVDNVKAINRVIQLATLAFEPTFPNSKTDK